MCVLDAPEEVESVTEKALPVRFDFIGSGGTLSRSAEKFRFEFMPVPKLASSLSLYASNDATNIGNGLFVHLTNPVFPSLTNSSPLLVLSGANVQYITKTPAPKNLKCDITAVHGKGGSIRKATFDVRLENEWLYIPLTQTGLHALKLGSGFSPSTERANELYVYCPDITAVAAPKGVFGFVGAHLEKGGEVLATSYSVIEYNNGTKTPPLINGTEKAPPASVRRADAANPDVTVSAARERNAREVNAGARGVGDTPVITAAGIGARASAATAPVPVIDPSQHFTIAVVLVGISIITALFMEIYT